MIAVLAVAAGVTWVHLLHREQVAGTAANCPVSAALVSAAGLELFAPVAPGVVEVRVLNATDRRGLAAQVAADLQVRGFSRATPVGNDVLHSPGSMRCVGQIRFGRNGVPAARTLSLMVPCAQLVQDERPDNTVDLALGRAFSAVDPDPAALAVLEQLEPKAADHAQPNGAVQPVTSGATPNASPTWPTAAHRCQ